MRAARRAATTGPRRAVRLKNRVVPFGALERVSRGRMVQWRMAIARRHCKTCRCFVKLKRHRCAKCKTRKLEKFMVRTGTRGAFGKDRWRCADALLCVANLNYG